VMAERLMTVAEIAERWRVSKMTVYRLVHAGTLRSIKVGRSIRVPESAVASVEQGPGWV
jgi:excisionase family DNA binding protein